MTTAIDSAKRRPRVWRLVSGASLALLAVGGCQRHESVTTQAPATAQPVTHAPAGQTAPAEPVVAEDAIPEGVLRAYVWQCADGQKLVMRNLLREKAVAIDFHDGTRRLDQTVAASGVRYADPLVVFWTRGSAATLERQGTPAVACEERRAESLREDARVRGVVYRALGNEPGWVLEIGPAGKLSWTTNYGEQRYDFDSTQESVTDGVASFTARQGNHAIKAMLSAERCVDDGEVEHDHAATIEFDGQVYRGCGTRLNPG
jgi:membrane-bound inhibitor of C-type lysozyme